MIKKLPQSKIEFEITVPWADWSKYISQAVSEISQEIKIPGFRPGKAPRNLVEKKVGRSAILNGAAQKAVSKSYADFVRQLADGEKLEVLGSPEIKIKELEEERDLKYSARTDVMPEIKVKESYKKDIRKINEKFKDKKPAVEDNEIDLELEKLSNSRVKLITVRREARKGDSVEIDFTVLVGNVPIENGTSKKHPLILGRGVFIPGFEDNLVGMKEGEEKEFELKFPGEYHKKELAGKPATFKVKMRLVQERQAPEINDDFAKSLGSFEDLNALKKSIREGLEREREHKIQEDKRGEYIERIGENTEIEIPEILAEKETEKMIAEFESQISSMGMNLEEYLSKINKKKEGLIQDWRPQAEKRVVSSLALAQIAKDDKIEADSSEVEAEMNKTLAYYKGVKDMEKNIDMERLYSYSKSLIENEKVFEMLEKL